MESACARAKCHGDELCGMQRKTEGELDQIKPSFCVPRIVQHLTPKFLLACLPDFLPVFSLNMPFKFPGLAPVLAHPFHP